MEHLYEVQKSLIGQEHHKVMQSSYAVVVGVGGLGCCVLQSLVRLGVNKITLIDGDTVEASNLPRQVLFDGKDIGRPKVECAKEKLSQFSAKLSLKLHQTYLNSENGKDLLEGHQAVFDCTDNYASRYAISKTCKRLNIPIIYGGVHGFEGQVGVFNYNNSKSFHEAFPDFKRLVEEESCGASGVLPSVVQIVGNYQVIEFFKLKTNSDTILNNKLLCINTLTAQQRILKLT